MPDALVDYIKQLQSQGYDNQAIRQFLLNNGYDSAVIEGAIRVTEKKPFLSTLFRQKEQKPNPQLLQYIRQQVYNGYNPVSIREFLLSKGYDPNQVETSLNEVTKGDRDSSVNQAGNEITHKIELSGRTMMLVFVLLLGVVGAVFGINAMFAGNEEEKLLDYSISLSTKNIKSGEILYFVNKFMNLGTKRSYDVSLHYRISERYTGKIIDEWDETLAVDKINTNTRTREIPDDTIPGTYQLQVLVTYGSKEAFASELFHVSIESVAESCLDGIKNQDEEEVDCGGACRPCENTETCSDGILNQDETGVDCGGVCLKCRKIGTCSDRIKNQDEIGIDCGGVCESCIKEESCNDRIKNQNEEGVDCGGVCNDCKQSGTDDIELYNLAKNDAKTNPEAATDACLLIQDPRIKDDCHNAIAQATQDSSYCMLLVSESKRDICLMWFVQNLEDYEVCGDITNVYIRKSCESLANINNLIMQQNITIS